MKILMISNHLDAVRLERRGCAGLVRRALTDEKGDAVFGGIEVQEQVQIGRASCRERVC